MSGRLLIQLYRAHWKRLFLIGGIVAFSLCLYMSILMIVQNVNQQALDQTKPLVGADIVIEGSQAIDIQAQGVLEDVKKDEDIQISYKVEFSTNIFLSGSESKLVQVWGIDDMFPLYGNLDISGIDGIDPITEDGVYVDGETYEQFVRNNTIPIGTQEFRVSGIVESLPAASISFFDEGRIILIPFDQVDSTNLTEIGSRVSYQTLIKTKDNQSTQKIIQRLQDNDLFVGKYEISDANDRIGQIQGITSEFNRFITIILIVTFVLVVTTIYISVRTFFIGQKKHIAVLKLLGQRDRDTLMLYSALFALCFLIGWILACFISFLFMMVLQHISLTQDFVLFPHMWLQGFFVMLLLALVSLALPLKTFTTIAPLELLRPETTITQNNLQSGIQVGLSVVGIFLIYVISLQDILGGLLFVGGGSIVLLVLSVIVSLVLRGIVASAGNIRKSSFMIFDGLRSMILPGNQSVLMTLGILLVMTVLLLVTGVSRIFLTQLEIINQEQPSLYILNVLPEDLPYIQENHPDTQLYDVILSRIQTINSLSLTQYMQTLDREPNGGLTREFNVTSLPLNETSYLVGSAPMTGEVSLDTGFAQRLGVGVGDVLGFFIQGRTFDLEISSLRESVQDGSGPFFFIQFPQDQFKDAPKTFFWLIDVDENQKQNFKNTLLTDIGPHLSFIDTNEILETVRNITSKLIGVIRFLVGCILFFVGVSIAVCLDAMKSLKKYKVTVYGYLGATGAMLKKSLRYEQITLFGVALLSAGICAGVLLSLVLSYSDFLTWSRDVLLYMLLILCGTFVCILIMIKLLYRDIL